jgi:hypothetical protein
MQQQQWPRGVDIERAPRRFEARRSAGRIRKTIERLAAQASTLGWFDAAVIDFLAECERSSTLPPSRRLSIRLARLHARHYWRQLVSQRRFIEMAAKQALMVAAG